MIENLLNKSRHKTYEHSKTNMEKLGPPTTTTNQSVFEITDGFYQKMTPVYFIHLFFWFIWPQKMFLNIYGCTEF